MSGFTRQISLRMLAGIIRGIESATIATIFTETIPAMRKTGNPWWDADADAWHIRKRAHTTVMIGGTYQGAVNGRRAKQDGLGYQNFESSGRRWGQRLTRLGSARAKGKRASIVEHGGQLYLDVQKVRGLSVTYIDLRTNHLIPSREVIPFLVQEQESNTQQLAKQVQWRDYALSNIRELRMQGDVYQVRLDAVASQQRRAA